MSDVYPAELRPMAEELESFDIVFGVDDLGGGMLAISVAIGDDVLYIRDDETASDYFDPSLLRYVVASPASLSSGQTLEVGLTPREARLFICGALALED